MDWPEVYMSTHPSITINVVHGDLLTQQVDAIVNAANVTLLGSDRAESGGGQGNY